MVINSLQLKDFRNYSELELELDKGVNILYGNNAQGKTNVLEALYVGCTSKSHKSVKDRELISFGKEESHIKLGFEKKGIIHRIDMHIKKNRAKGIALDGIPVRRASELLGAANVVFFSPEDLGIIKNGPAERRRFLDVELCQLNKIYTYNLIAYGKIIAQKNALLKDISYGAAAEDILNVYNEQLVKYGTEIINIREEFINSLCGIISSIHARITDGRENIAIKYEKNTSAEDFEKNLSYKRQNEIRQQMCLTGPHRDDISFIINDIDIRHYGSQGQQRTASLSLKMSEIELVERITGDKPVLLLDDVLSELDRNRQTMLLNTVKDVQTVITCTGIDDFVNNRFHMDKVFHVENGTVTGEN